MSNNQRTVPTTDSIIESRRDLLKRLTDFTTELDQTLPSKNKANNINKLTIDSLKGLLKKITDIRDDLIRLRTDIGTYFLYTLRKDINERILSNLPNDQKEDYSNKALVISLIKLSNSIKNFISNKNASNAKVYIEKVVKFEEFIKAYKKIIEELNSRGENGLSSFKNIMKAAKKQSNQFGSQINKAAEILESTMGNMGNQTPPPGNNIEANLIEQKKELIGQIGKIVEESQDIAGTVVGESSTAGAGGNSEVSVRENNKVQNKTVERVRSAILKLGNKNLNTNEKNRFNSIITNINRNLINTYRTTMLSKQEEGIKERAFVNFRNSLKQKNATKKLESAVNALDEFISDIVGKSSTTGAAGGAETPEQTVAGGGAETPEQTVAGTGGGNNQNSN